MIITVKIATSPVVLYFGCLVLLWAAALEITIGHWRVWQVCIYLSIQPYYISLPKDKEKHLISIHLFIFPLNYTHLLILIATLHPPSQRYRRPLHFCDGCDSCYRGGCYDGHPSFAWPWCAWRQNCFVLTHHGRVRSVYLINFIPNKL